MTLDKTFWHSKLITDTANLVLKEPAEWLTKLKMHLLWKSTYVMMTLDNHTCNAKTLNTVWVDSTLCEPLSISNLLCLSIKHLNEVTTNNLTFLLWVGNTFQILKELF